MKYAEKLKKKLCKEIDEIAERPDMRASDVEILYKMINIAKTLDKIEMLEVEGDDMSMRGSYRSESYESMARGGRGRSRGSYEGDSYESGDSYARRGEHYVRGHYSRDYGMSNDRGRGRGYSRNDAKDVMLNKIGEMMTEANSEEREILKKAMRQIEDVE